jgi:hypothetical protein
VLAISTGVSPLQQDRNDTQWGCLLMDVLTCAEVAAAAAGWGQHMPEVLAFPVHKQAVAAHHQHAACKVSGIGRRTSELAIGLSVWCPAGTSYCCNSITSTLLATLASLPLEALQC